MVSAPSDFFLLNPRLFSMVAGLSHHYGTTYEYYVLTENEAAYLFYELGTILVVGHKNPSTNKREERSSFSNNLYCPMRPCAAFQNVLVNSLTCQYGGVCLYGSN